ncbi:MAG TPA: hypothetical protein VGI64_15235 [Streptosporangiaceae bacterium]
MPVKLARMKAWQLDLRSDLVGADGSPVARRLCRLWATDQIGNWHQGKGHAGLAGQLDLQMCPACSSGEYQDCPA